MNKTTEAFKFHLLTESSKLTLKVKPGGPKPYALLDPNDKSAPYEHFTLPLAPTPDGEDAGLVRPHLTGFDGEHDWLAKLLPEDIASAVQAFSLDVARQYRTVCKRVELTDLDSGNFVAFAPTEDQFKSVFGKYVSSGKSLDLRHLDGIEGDSLSLMQGSTCMPSALASREGDDNAIFTAWRLTDDDHVAEAVMLQFFKYGLGEGYPPGWYIAPQRWIEKLNFEELCERHFGPRFLPLVQEILVGLGLSGAPNAPAA